MTLDMNRMEDASSSARDDSDVSGVRSDTDPQSEGDVDQIMHESADKVSSPLGLYILLFSSDYSYTTVP